MGKGVMGAIPKWVLDIVAGLYYNAVTLPFRANTLVWKEEASNELMPEQSKEANGTLGADRK